MTETCRLVTCNRNNSNKNFKKTFVIFVLGETMAVKKKKNYKISPFWGSLQQLFKNLKNIMLINHLE